MQQEQLKQFAFVQEKLHATPLSMDDIVTLILLQQLKQATLTQLIEASAIPRTSMSRSLRKLSKLDLISESVDTHDLRKVNYTIAMKGDGVLYELMRGGNASAKVLLNGYRVLRAAQTEPSDYAGRVLLLALYYAHKEGKLLSITHIIAQTGFARSRVSMCLSRLVEQGFVEEAEEHNAPSRQHQDARMRNWKLTRKGVQQAKKMLALQKA